MKAELFEAVFDVDDLDPCYHLRFLDANFFAAYFMLLSRTLGMLRICLKMAGNLHRIWPVVESIFEQNCI